MTTANDAPERQLRIANFNANKRTYITNFRENVEDVYNATRLSYKYKYKDSENDWDFGCPLQCIRCCAIAKNGQMCKKKTCKMVPFCVAHAKTIFNVQVKNAEGHVGNGLYAVKTRKNTADDAIIFRTGDIICWYIGEVIGVEEKDERYGHQHDATAPYAFQDRHNRIIDAACLRGVGSYINSPAGRNNLQANCKFVTSQPTVPFASLVATRNIRNGTEILVSYGRAYRFDVSKHETVAKKMRQPTHNLQFDALHTMIDNAVNRWN